MRTEDLTVALRPRTPWEAVELGTALARRHFGAVLRPWLAFCVPVFVLVNLLCWALGVVWLAALVMWWLKPVFDRVPLFVLSRAVFGRPPGTRQALRAQFAWGLRWMPAYLTWRRLSPWRSLNLPVDLLEGARGDDARTRRSALASPVYGVGALVTLVFSAFEFVLLFGLISVALLFVPEDAAQEVTVRAWRVAVAQPVWLQLVFNGLTWLVTTFLEPFYIGAGFGLYLNRRTQIECWDIEMVLRRLRDRLSQAVAPLVVLAAFGLALGMAAAPVAHAQARNEGGTMQEVFGPDAVQDEGWKQAVKRTYEDPNVRPRKQVTQWEPRDPRKPREPASGGWWGKLLGVVGEYGIWAVFGLIALVALLTSPRWLRWMRDAATREPREDAPVRVEEAPPVAPLPADVPAAALRLWREGHARDALALMYRASVEDMARRANVVLVPGATEAHTLRASRRLPRERDREVFARTVRTWQLAAYAHGQPDEHEFQALLRDLVQAFGWPTATGLDRVQAQGPA
jgi:hypothetical protein